MTDVAHSLMTLFGVDELERPWLGLALLALGVVLALRRLRSVPPAIPWPATSELSAASGGARDWGRAAFLALRLGTLACLAAAVASPVAVFRGSPEPGQGMDMVLAVDTSGSMRALDAELGGGWRRRLDLAREVVSRFARERAAEGDRVGLVVFGENAFTQCPLSSDGALLAAALDRVEAGMAGEATALGDALALAVRRVLGSAPQPGRGAADAVAGRVVVLLTDGRSNAGEVPTDIAAGLARTLGVRVHAVGIGGEGPVPMAGAAGAGPRFERHDLDRETLSLIARSTGGRFFHARRAQDLAAIYAEIDTLERVPRRPPPRLRRSARPEPALAAAGCLLALELLCGRILRRRIA